MSISKIDIYKFCDYLPIVSSISNITIIFLKAKKYLQGEHSSPLTENAFLVYVADKKVVRCVILIFLPFVGNIGFFIYDLMKSQTQLVDLTTAAGKQLQNVPRRPQAQITFMSGEYPFTITGSYLTDKELTQYASVDKVASNFVRLFFPNRQCELLFPFTYYPNKDEERIAFKTILKEKLASLEALKTDVWELVSFFKSPIQTEQTYTTFDVVGTQVAFYNEKKNQVEIYDTTESNVTRYSKKCVIQLPQKPGAGKKSINIRICGELLLAIYKNSFENSYDIDFYSIKNQKEVTPSFLGAWGMAFSQEYIAFLHPYSTKDYFSFVQVYDTKTAKSLEVLRLDPSPPEHSIGFSIEKGALIQYTFKDQSTFKAKIYDITSGERIKEVILKDPSDLTSFTPAESGLAFMTGKEDSVKHLVNIYSQEIIRSFHLLKSALEIRLINNQILFLLPDSDTIMTFRTLNSPLKKKQ
jgi:hypothetical protein